MNFDTLMLMRQEILLVGVIMILLVATIARINKSAKGVVYLGIFLFGLLTVVGFLPQEMGVLFGGMYQVNETTLMMKNILNVGVFILLLQSTSWILSEENEGNSNEFILILLSILVGMDYMISAGDFLMLFLVSVKNP